MNVKINRFQLFSIFIMGRAFSECLNVPNEVSFYGMQRFTVIFLARALLLCLCIPLIVFVKKHPGESVFSVVAKKSKTMGWTLFVFLAFHLVFMTVFLSVKYELYVQNTVMSTASSFTLIVIFFVAVFYVVAKGLEASMRAASALIVIFVLFLIVSGAALLPKMNMTYLYPAFIDNPDTLLFDIYSETVKNTEIYIFLLLNRYTAKNSGNLLFLLMLFSILVVEYMHFTYVTILGPYLDSVSFPFYTNASLADIIVFDRLDGIDMVIWTITSVLEVAMMIFCIKSMLFDLISHKKAEIVALFFTICSAILALWGSLDRSSVVNMYSPLYMGITLMIFVVALPFAASFIRRKGDKKDAENNSLPATD